MKKLAVILPLLTFTTAFGQAKPIILQQAAPQVFAGSVNLNVTCNYSVVLKVTVTPVVPLGTHPSIQAYVTPNAINVPGAMCTVSVLLRSSTLTPGTSDLKVAQYTVYECGNNVNDYGNWQPLFQGDVMLPAGPAEGATPVGTNVSVTPRDAANGQTPMTLSFDQVTQAGQTSLTLSPSGPPLPTGFGLGNPPTYFNVTTTAVYGGLIHVRISYAGIAFTGPAEALQLFHYDNGQWVDCTTGVDTQAQVISGQVTSLSPFAILRDTMPPVIKSITATPNVLWPPNHKMVNVAVTVDAADNSGRVPTRRIVNVVNSGATGAAPSWEITGDLTVRLCADRTGSGGDRTYTIQVQCADAAGNTTTGSVDVIVPHDQGQNK